MKGGGFNVLGDRRGYNSGVIRFSYQLLAGAACVNARSFVGSSGVYLMLSMFSSAQAASDCHAFASTPLCAWSWRGRTAGRRPKSGFTDYVILPYLYVLSNQ